MPYHRLYTQKGARSIPDCKGIMAKKNKQKKGISCLGALLIFCMLLIAACTVTVNLLFRNGAAPHILGNRYCYYTYDDMGDRVPKGSLVIAEDVNTINMQDIVLYRNDHDEYRIAVASLIVDTSSNVPEQTAKTYYLTTVSESTAVQAEEDAIVGICRRRSPELGVVIGFLTGTIGLIAGLVAPCLILLIYMIAVLAGGKKKDEDINEDEDTDLAFVKSIQQKQQQIAERDAERMAKEKQNQTFDDAFYDHPDAPAPAKKPHLSDEEIAKLEEEEASRRAERIAAVRTHMESRRQTETPDGVPLYTTEIITKTHTLPIPKTGNEKPAKPAPQLKPTPTSEIPRLTATGHLQIPTAEQIEAERVEQDRLAKAQALAKATQDEAFGMPAPKKTEKPAPAPAPAPVQEAPAPAPAPAEPASAPAPAPAKPKKQRIASSSFSDLMAFLDDEQKKL